ncbi:MAG: hypothetical protein GY938_13290 [Ketobacter sp.]|nr:hypothetical protein [Ketobacter sp.]
MTRETDINEAIALIEDALSKGEIEEKFVGCIDNEGWREPVDPGIVIGDIDYQYRAKKQPPREFWLAPVADDSMRRNQWVEVDDPETWAGPIKVREVTDD